MVLTLCGSARFEMHFKAWNEALSLSGHAVFSLGSYPSDRLAHGRPMTAEHKKILDAVYRFKIERSDGIVVLNPFAYIGESTLGEIEFARSCDKKIYAIESWGRGCGITAMHTANVRERAASYGCVDARSPVDTYYPHMIDAIALLPPSGSLRSELVQRLRPAS